MKNFKKLGVIGGMGPEATALLLNRVIALTEAHDDQDHVPLVVDMNPQIPSRLAALWGDGGISPVPALTEMTKNLEGMGAAALAMPCNTAHYYAQDFMSTSTIPLLNMIKLSAKRISKLGKDTRRVGMLASPATDKFNIFQDVFDGYGLTCIFPENEADVLSLIRRIKSDGISPELADGLSVFVKELESRGAQCLLVGCSEFSLLTATLSSSLPIFDSVDLLAQAMVEFSGAKLKPAKDALRFT
ncbi:amino acid racemase [Hellea sp.]|nr:amino acid racemase [Hellea sp.]